jgi:NTP pyrophosphatase (non-canonical NTP hydrolase)
MTNSAVLSLKGWQVVCRECLCPTERDANEIWLVATYLAGEIARSIRSSRIGELRDGKKLTRLLIAILHFANIVGFDLSEYAWRKYPRSCPYCIAYSRMAIPEFHKPTDYFACCCPPPPKKTNFCPDDPILSAHVSYMRIPGHLKGWQDLFEGVYSHRHLKNLDRLAYHFIEEIGEVAGALAFGEHQSTIAYETADVFSWSISLANAIGRFFSKRIALEETMNDSLQVLESILATSQG